MDLFFLCFVCCDFLVLLLFEVLFYFDWDFALRAELVDVSLDPAPIKSQLSILNQRPFYLRQLRWKMCPHEIRFPVLIAYKQIKQFWS